LLLLIAVIPSEEYDTSFKMEVGVASVGKGRRLLATQGQEVRGLTIGGVKREQ
jgi:hypothetical protein